MHQVVDLGSTWQCYLLMDAFRPEIVNINLRGL